MLKEEFESISERMRIDFEQVTKMISHPVVKGTARENALQTYLRPHIPDKFEISEGIIVDSHDHQSCQVDMIIHDKIATPYLLDTNMKKVIPIESVYAIIEVKSTLTKDELRKCIYNIQSVRSLTKNTLTGQTSPTLGFVFAYDSDSSLETIYSNFHELTKSIPLEQQISAICVLNKGLILSALTENLSTIILNPSKETTFAMYNNSDNALLMFYLLLFQALNTIIIYPPNMMAYANSTGDFSTMITIPKDFLPDSAGFPFLNQKISGAEIKKAQDYSARVLRGEANRDDFLDCLFGYQIPFLSKVFGSVENAIGRGGINLYGEKISNEEFVHLYNIYNKGASASEQESKQLQDFLDRIYTIYEKLRPELKTNKKDGVMISFNNSQ